MTPQPALSSAGLTTTGLSLSISADPYLTQNLTLVPLGDSLLKSAQARAFPVELMLPGGHLRGDDFSVTTLYADQETVIATCGAAGVEVRLTWSLAYAGALRLLIQLRTSDPQVILDGTLRLALLDHIHPGPLEQRPRHDPGRGPLAPDGRPLVRGGQYVLPWSWWSDGAGVAILERRAPDVSFAPTWTPVQRDLPVRLRNEWSNASELVIMPCAAGWLGVFTAWREQLRCGVDLSAYGRPDLAWYRDQWVQHFAFLYGSEIYDHEHRRLDIDRLLDEGQRFGGYDGVLLWPAYPRIGVDERDQFDFYDDLPGGQPAIKALAARARARGARVFIPYLPWDMIPDARHGRPAAAPGKLAQAIADMDIDGVFLDTMDSIRPQFRAAIDVVRPGVVFCAELQPAEALLDQITGSWDQAEHQHTGEVDLLRFLIPEHPRFVINRHAIGAHRERVVGRALFNGMGVVVWQDIFGEVLPFTAGQAALTRDTATILRQFSHCFRGADALPLVPTTHPGIVANGFLASDGTAVVTVYNVSEQSIDGDLVTWQPSDGTHYDWRQISHSARAAGAHADGQGVVREIPSGLMAPAELAVFVGAPRSASE